MKTILERRSEKQIPLGRNDKLDLPKDRPLISNDRSAVWARTFATAGATVWAGIAVLARLRIARMGAIEFAEGFTTHVRGEPAIVTLGSFGRIAPL